MFFKLMDMFDSYPDTCISLGEETLSGLVSLLGKLDTRKIVAFTGNRSVEENGAWHKILHFINHSDIDIVRFSRIEAEPCTDTVYAMKEFLDTEKPDQVIAVGGGSVLDAAKAAWLLFQGGGYLDDYFGMNRFSQSEPARVLKKVICFPTTSGTGSEATPYSNIVDKELNVKKLIVEAQIIPQYSFLVPEFTFTMNRETTVATACDALAHSLEGFLNVGQDANHPQANDWALESIKLITKHLPAVLKDAKDLRARTALSGAACLGGMVIRYKSTGLPHLCSFSWFGKILHGIAVSVLLPYAWDFYLKEEKVRERTTRLKGIFPDDDGTPEGIVKGYVEFLRSISVPVSFKEYPGITMKLMEDTASTAGENKMKLELAPRPVPLEKSREILMNILQNSMTGKLF